MLTNIKHSIIMSFTDFNFKNQNKYTCTYFDFLIKISKRQLYKSDWNSLNLDLVSSFRRMISDSRFRWSFLKTLVNIHQTWHQTTTNPCKDEIKYMCLVIFQIVACGAISGPYRTYLMSKGGEKNITLLENRISPYEIIKRLISMRKICSYSIIE